MENASLRVQESEPEHTPMYINTNSEADEPSASSAFIEANTIPISFSEIQTRHIIPVYVKDNEPLISQADFIQAVAETVADLYRGEKILQPQIRVSHPIKGRIPDAKDKPASQLQEWEKTLYYERMMFVIEIPTVMDTIAGNQLTLTIGGVKAYNLDNLYTRKGAVEHFKLFIGFNNMVCTNMCVRTDGYQADLKVGSIEQLQSGIHRLLDSYDQHRHLKHLQTLTDYSLTEHQFAQLLGRCRMYPYLTTKAKKEIPPLLFGDSQLTIICRNYYKDGNFSREVDGSVDLWKLYNLFTGANKSTYIDQFLDRSVNANDFAFQLQEALDGHSSSWYFQ